MDVKDELIKIEIEKLLKNKIDKYMTKIIDDFNNENNGVEIDTIKMENISYLISINDKKINYKGGGYNVFL